MSTARAPRVEPRRQRSEPARPRLRVVEAPEAGSRRSPGRVGTVAGAILFAALFALAGFQTVLVNGQARLDDLDKRIATEQSRRTDLGVSLATLQSPERITSTARDRLGMIAPLASAYLHPSPDDDARATYVAPVQATPPTSTAPTTRPTPTTTPTTTQTTKKPPTPTTTPPTPTTTQTTKKPSTPTTTQTTTPTTRAAGAGAR